MNRSYASLLAAFFLSVSCTATERDLPGGAHDGGATGGRSGLGGTPSHSGGGGSTSESGGSATASGGQDVSDSGSGGDGSGGKASAGGSASGGDTASAGSSDTGGSGSGGTASGGTRSVDGGGSGGSPSTSGEQVVWASGLYFPGAVAVGGTYVFITDGTEGEILRKDRSNAAGDMELVTSSAGKVAQLLAHEHHVFVRVGNRVDMFDEDGGNLKTVLPTVGKWTMRNGSHYYTVDSTGTCTCSYHPCGASTTGVGCQPVTEDCSQTDVRCNWSTCSCGTDDGKLMTAAADGTGARQIGAATVPTAEALAVNDVAAFVAHDQGIRGTCYPSTSITRLPLNGATVQPLGTVYGPNPPGLWVDASHVYSNSTTANCSTGVYDFVRAVSTGGAFARLGTLWEINNVFAGKSLTYLVAPGVFSAFDPAKADPTITRLYPKEGVDGGADGVAYDGDHFFVTDGSIGKLVRITE